MTDIHFINLTNGLLAINEYGLTDYRFIRLQSTWCEQKRWGDILTGISDDFLMHAALGNKCIVYDYGANKEVSRAIWQGLEWVKYCLSLRWGNIQYKPTGRASQMAPYFSQQYNNLARPMKNRLDYFGQYNTGPTSIEAICSSTNLDGNIIHPLAKARGEG